MHRGGRNPTPEATTSAPAWRTVLDWLLFTAVLYMGSLLLLTAKDAANANAQQSIIKHEARELFRAFENYYERNRSYPNSYTEPRFDPATLDPLARRGYYEGNLLTNLRDHRIDAYDSPDDQGPNREFWVEMSLEDDPTVRVVVANSDDAPLGGGRWLNGVFIFRDGTLEPF